MMSTWRESSACEGQARRRRSARCAAPPGLELRHEGVVVWPRATLMRLPAKSASEASVQGRAAHGACCAPA